MSHYFAPPPPDRLLLDALEVGKVIAVMRGKGYAVFSNPKGYDLNLFVIRAEDPTPNRFNDVAGCFFRYRDHTGDRWASAAWPVTVDPGATYLGSRSLNPEGTAIIAEGQYRGMWRYGFHKGRRSFEQIGKCDVIRDFDRDGRLDYDSGRIQRGVNPKLNGHKARYAGITDYVNGHSAGCVVWQIAEHHDAALGLAKGALDAGWGNSFTLTVLHERDFN